jgi:hypothetical protein
MPGSDPKGNLIAGIDYGEGCGEVRGDETETECRKARTADLYDPLCSLMA